MGKTLLSANQNLQAIQSQWADFRRALRKEDQEIFDAIFSLAKKHVSAQGVSNNPFPFETVLMSVLIELFKKAEQVHGGADRRQNKGE